MDNTTNNTSNHPDLNPQPLSTPLENPELSAPNTFKKILVAIDKKRENAIVFERALALAKAESSQLMIFHCVADPIPTTPNVLVAGSIGVYGGNYSPEVFQQLQEVRREEREQILLWLKGFYEQASLEKVAAEFDYKEGDPGYQICHCAKEWQADLVILGRRGRTAISEILLGSVSNYVVHHAPCTVMVVQDKH